MGEKYKINKLNITVGQMLFSFHSFQDWVKTAQDKFQAASVSARDVICVDSEGRICCSGKEFSRAENEKTFPVWVYQAVIKE